MMLEDAVTEFFIAKDHTPATRRYYRHVFAPFLTWASKQGAKSTDDLTAPLVRRYLDERRNTPNQLTGEPLSSYSLSTMARGILAWLNWMVEEDLLDPRVPARIKPPKKDHRVLRVLDAKQIDRLFLAAEQSPTPIRDKAILSVLLDTGIRAGEMCGLERHDVSISPDDGYLLIRHGKGRRQREVPLGKRARLALARLLRSHPHEAVFVGKGSAALTPNGLDQVLYALYDHAGRHHFQDLKLGAHLFRHTFAVRYLEAGGDIYRLSRIMGHSQVTTTEGYLRAFTAKQARQRSISPLDAL